jgi:hypothetical protein
VICSRKEPITGKKRQRIRRVLAAIREEENMGPNLGAFLVLLILSLAVPTILFLLLRGSLRELLQHTIKLPGGVTFYLRTFLLVLYFSALSVAVGTSFDLPAGSHAMQYVWKEAEGMSSTMEATLLVVGIYVVVITILVATLKIKDEQ